MRLGDKDSARRSNYSLKQNNLKKYTLKNRASMTRPALNWLVLLALSYDADDGNGQITML